MKKFLIVLGLAIVMTWPVAFAISRVPGLIESCLGGAGYELLRPLFDAYGAIGVEDDMDVVITILLTTSFALSILFATFFLLVLRHYRIKKRTIP
ncbi:hypothetical protein GCT13_26570 [Paraburkholderia sp. CNPSo 3157]|uniref:Uncharacterized protein n=1 Tax=Paraburkholderia franconis TaxID=2654983 RepID=A0A7X1TIL9_9BURK|nr:hypothetical protein [Paraburkholderia franconis]MPW20354.1 hypothetical protein [Paraburkholderia franconis]